MSDQSITYWAKLLQQRDEEAARKIWENYYQRIIAVARKRLGIAPKRAFDEEDVALAALNSFIRGVEEAKFPELTNRSNLWRILVTITANKARDLVKGELAEKRGGGKLRGESVFLKPGVDGSFAGIAQALASDHAPDVAVELGENLDDLLDRLADPNLQEIALLKLEGHSNEEVATKIGRSLATVERRLKRIREKWMTQKTNL